MSRKILVEVTQEELDTLNKGLKEISISDFEDEELISEVIRRFKDSSKDAYSLYDPVNGNFVIAGETELSKNGKKYRFNFYCKELYKI